MSDSGQSRKQMVDRKMEALSAKWKTRIWFWKEELYTRQESEPSHSWDAEMRHYNLHVLGISDSRLTGSGRHKTNTGETVLYSGRDDQHHEGIAIILKKGLEKCPMELKPIKWDWKGDTSTQLSSSVKHQQTTVTKKARTPSRTASSRTAEPRDEMKIVM